MALNVCDSLLCSEKSRKIIILLHMDPLSKRIQGKKGSCPLGSLPWPSLHFWKIQLIVTTEKYNPGFQTNHICKLEPRRKLGYRVNVVPVA